MTPASLRHALRSLARTPVFTLTAVFTLVIGVAATVAIFTVVNRVLLRPLPYGNSERLVGAWHDMPPLNLTHTQHTLSTYFAYQRHAKSIEGIGVYQEGSVNVADPGGAGEPQRLACSWITSTVIPVLQIQPTLGRNFTEAEDRPKGPNVVIISDAMWRARFNGDRSVIGRTLDVNGTSRQIVGVMPATFRFPLAATQLWLPLALDPNSAYSDGFNYDGVARLKPGVTLEAAHSDFAAVLKRLPELFPAFAPGVSTQMVMDQAKPVPSLIPMRKDVTGDIAGTLWMIAAAAGLVLLVACANVANLILVRADSRQRELAVREALGAGRARVLGHFLAESAVLSFAAGVLGLGIATLAVRMLVVSGPTDLPRLAEVSVGATEVLFAALVSGLVALVCSIIPALRIGRVQLGSALREGGRGGTTGRARQRVRGVLVAAQIALALVVLAGSGLLLRTFQRLNAVQPGFDAERVTTYWLAAPSARYRNDTALVQFYSQLTAKVAALPGVQSVGISSRLPLMRHGMNLNPFYTEDDASSAAKIPQLHIFTTIDGGYFRTMGIPLIAGRNFDALETQRGSEAIVSQRTAEQFFKDSTGRAALGKRFRPLPSGPWYTIIGVAGNARDTALTAIASHTVYFPQSLPLDTLFSQMRRTMALVVRSTGEPAAIIPTVRGALRELDPTLPAFDVQPMSTVIRASMARLQFVILILGSAALVALLLGAVGLYGVMAYLVTLRTRELGVRIALGAQPRAVAAMMTRQGLVLTAGGIAGGLIMFSLVARFLRTFLFGVAPSDPVALLGASLTLVVIASLASWIPARRASRVNPVEALRAE
jgi:putative ABC transport system permease protein